MKSKKINGNEMYISLCKTAYSLKEDDLSSAAELMSAAFHDDPAIRYLLGGTGKGDADSKYFLCALKAIYGKCAILSSDKYISNLLILFPPELKSVPTVPFLLNGGIGLYKHFGKNLFLRSFKYENNCNRIKRRYITPNTWYCMCFVVSPKKQGRGCGSKLIKPVLEIFSVKNIPLYLETHKEHNIPIYNHLGFEVLDISKIPGTETKQYALLKK